MKDNEYGMPYMGGKRKLSSKIVQSMLNAMPQATHIYDLFGGGGAISFECLRRGLNVNYNEFNTGVVELLKKICSESVTPDFYQWIDRETFNKHKNDNDWFGGLCKVIWSFGNNQSSYLFGKNLETFKKLGHEIVVNKDNDARLKLSAYLGVEISQNIFLIDGINNRRLAFHKIITDSKKRFDLQKLKRLQQLEGLQRLQNLERLQHLERLEHLEGLQQLERLQHLEGLQQLEGLQRLQNLERLQQLEQLERLKITNFSYENVIIDTPVESTIIYCDPPYKGTHTYQNDIDHDIFLNWVKNHKYTVFVSSYKFDLPCVESYRHRSTLNNIKNNAVVENLYCNKPVSTGNIFDS